MPAALFVMLLLGSPVPAQDRVEEVVNMNGRDWSLEMSAALPWAEAEEYCESLESGGFSDWRLPTLAELEQLHEANTSLVSRLSTSPFDFEDCCAWTSQNLATLPAERKGQLPAQSGAPETYNWGFMFEGAVSYYSNGRFDDGFALCTRGD
jgi:hypothetical protein